MRRLSSMPHCHARLVRASGPCFQTPAQGGRDASREKGGVLIWILVAVGLFAALSFAMSQGSRSSVSMITATQADLAATEIMGYADTIRGAVQRLRIGGCKEDEFDFHNTVWTNMSGIPTIAANANPKRRMDGGCAVFGPAGGIVPKMISDIAVYPVTNPGSTKPGSLNVRRMALPGVGTPAEDVVLFLPFPRPEVCLKINEKMGIPLVDGGAPKHEWSTAAYNGSWTGAGLLTDTDGAFEGKRTICTLNNLSQMPWEHRFFHVLIAR